MLQNLLVVSGIIWPFLVLLVVYVLVFSVVVLPAARKTEVGNAVSSAAALSYGETCGDKMKLD